jgi:enoyl-CoA hydratase/carnithine racemase
MAHEVICNNENGVMLITLNRPQHGNCITQDMVYQISKVCDDINADEQYKAVIVTGSGTDIFCSGREKDEAGLSSRVSIPDVLNSLRCPVIAAINGNAFGEGLEIALTCDIRIAVKDAKFGLPAIEQGRIPSEGATQLLPRIVGITKAMEMILTGESIDAVEALRIGLISKIVESVELLPSVTEMAQIMTTKSPLALSFAKEAINKGLDLTLDQGLRLEADLYFLLHTTEDRSEGIKAFREKRKPHFKGK